MVGAVLDVLRGTGRTFVHNSGFWVTGDTFLAVSDGPHRAREIAEAASRAGGADGRVEAWPLDEALETLGDYACALVLDQRLSSERARRILGWTPSAPLVFEELERGSCSQERSVTHYCRNGLAL